MKTIDNQTNICGQKPSVDSATMKIKDVNYNRKPES